MSWKKHTYPSGEEWIISEEYVRYITRPLLSRDELIILSKLLSISPDRILGDITTIKICTEYNLDNPNASAKEDIPKQFKK